MSAIIQSLDLFSITLPFSGLFKTSRGAVGSAASGRRIILVKLTTSDGVVGWGEGSPIAKWSPETSESVFTTLESYFGPAVLGRPLTDLDGLHRAMDSAIAPLYGLSMPIARAAIDIAAHDALARTLGLPIRDLLGYARAEQVQLSWTITGTDQAEVGASIEEARCRGFRSCNIKLGGARWWDVELCRTIKASFPQGYLWGDANGGMAPHEAPARAVELARAGLDLLEQPVPPDQSEASAQVLAASPVPVALDEPITGPAPMMDNIHRRALSALAMKVTRNGGFRPSIQCAQMAEAAGLLLVSSGLTDGGVAFAANAHLAAAFGITHPCALNGPQFLLDDVLCVSLPREADMVHIPDSPGLGIVVDEQKVIRLAADPGGHHVMVLR